MSKPNKKSAVFLTGGWSGRDWVEDGVPSYTAIVIANLNDRTNLDAALRHRMAYKRFNAEYSGTWAIHKKTEFDEWQCNFQ